MDEKSVEEIAEFTEGLDATAKKRILEKCRTKINNDNKNGVINMKINSDIKYTEAETKVKRTEKARIIPTVLSVAACFAVIIGSAAVISQLKKDNNNISPSSTFTEVTSETTAESYVSDISDVSSEAEIITSFPETAVTEETHPAEQTSAPATEATEVTEATEATVISEKKPDDYTKEYSNIFINQAEELGTGYILTHGFGIKTSNNEVLLYDTEDESIYYCGDTDFYYENREDYIDYPFLNEAYPVDDSRFSSNQDYTDYMLKIFTENYLSRYCGGTDHKRFIEADGKIFEPIANKGLLFDKWNTDSFNIEDIIPDKSFTVITETLIDTGESITNVKINYVKTQDGWKVDDIIDISD